MRNEAYWRYQVYRDRVARSLADRFPLRLHMSIIVAVAIAAAVGFDALLVAIVIGVYARFRSPAANSVLDLF